MASKNLLNTVIGLLLCTAQLHAVNVNKELMHPWKNVSSRYSDYYKSSDVNKVDVVHTKKQYILPAEPIDVIFVCHVKDARTLNLAIDGIKKNGQNVRRVIVISSEKLTDQAEWFNEAFFPFTKEILALEIFKGSEQEANDFIAKPNSSGLVAKRPRIGWIYQQLLKLYAPFVVPGISSNVLAVDADTVFLRPVAFINEQRQSLFNTGKECHVPYFKHAARLLPGFKRQYVQHSGICHHMLFQRPVLEDLFTVISTVHATEPWRAICRCIDLKELHKCALSEYEIYFNFAFARTEQVKVRALQWKNIQFEDFSPGRYKGLDYVSCHHLV